MIKTIKNIQALSAFKQNRLNQKLSKLSVALVGAEFVLLSFIIAILSSEFALLVSSILSFPLFCLSSTLLSEY
jgi:hypothetical protein